MKRFLTSSFAILLDLLYPRRCFSCREFLGNGTEALCPPCEAGWPALEPPFCPACCYPFPAPGGESHLCGDCLKQPKICRRVCATGIYRGILHDLIVRMKYRGEERLGPWLGERMAKMVPPGQFDLVLPIPLFRDRLRERGFNQSLLLARQIGRVRGIEVDPFLLVKKRSTTPQTNLKGEERRKNLKGAFELKDLEKVEGKTILLVDDVYTTGATIEAASRPLLKAGASAVEAIVVARAA